MDREYNEDDASHNCGGTMPYLALEPHQFLIEDFRSPTRNGFRARVFASFAVGPLVNWSISWRSTCNSTARWLPMAQSSSTCIA